MNNCKQTAQELLTFIQNCPTAFHTVHEISNKLNAFGFTALSEGTPWSLQPGKSYYVTRNQSSLLAFTLPNAGTNVSGYQIISAHNDSPSFKLKDNFDCFTPDGYQKLNTERYGGMICSSWMDRPLSIAGRVLLSTENGIESRLVHFDRDMALIPNVAIHMDRSVNDGKSYNAQIDMLPLFGIGSNNESFKNQLLNDLQIQESQFIGHDLFLYVRDSGCVWGNQAELVSAPRLDDLMCVFGALQAFCHGAHPNIIPVLAIFDNEEVGSSTRQGAASSFLDDILSRIEHSDALQSNQETRFSLRNHSLMLSADNAHAVHPNHPEYADNQNRPVINGGIVLKFNAAQRYATDGVGAAIFRRICQNAQIPVQSFANRSDMTGGSTLGNIATTRIPIRTIDIGLPQLAMHSAYETAGTQDLLHYIKGCDAFYHTRIHIEDENHIALHFC